MKGSAAFHCLLMATAVLAAATLPLTGVAQETLPNDTSAATLPVPEKRFVSDKLVLNVYAGPESGSGRIATIQTGDSVEALERAENMVRVRLEDGREGWVGASYLVSDAPAILRLRELQRQQPAAEPRIDKASTDQIAKLTQENAALKGQVSELQARVAATPVAAVVESDNTAEPPTPEPPLEAAAFASPVPSGGIWGWVVATILAGTLGFAGGYQTLARRLRKRFGGLKIY